MALVPPGVGRGERGTCMCQRCRQRLLHDILGMAGRGMREAAMRAAKTEKRARGQVGMSDARTHLPSPSMPLYTKSDTMSCHENAAGGAPPTEAMPMAAAGMATRPGRCVQKKRADTSSCAGAQGAFCAVQERRAAWESQVPCVCVGGEGACGAGAQWQSERSWKEKQRTRTAFSGLVTQSPEGSAPLRTALAWLIAAFFQTTRPPWPSTYLRVVPAARHGTRAAGLIAHEVGMAAAALPIQLFWWQLRRPLRPTALWS